MKGVLQINSSKHARSAVRILLKTVSICQKLNTSLRVHGEFDPGIEFLSSCSDFLSSEYYK